jgi:hypothetical protein
MLKAIVASVALFATLAAGAYPSAPYTLVKDYQAGTSAFWSNFNFYTGADPKGGFVQYGLAYSVDCRFQSPTSGADMYWNWQNVSYIAPDWWNQAPSGRRSLRLEGIAVYTQVLVIADFAHFPVGYTQMVTPLT